MKWRIGRVDEHIESSVRFFASIILKQWRDCFIWVLREDLLFHGFVFILSADIHHTHNLGLARKSLCNKRSLQTRNGDCLAFLNDRRKWHLDQKFMHIIAEVCHTTCP